MTTKKLFFFSNRTHQLTLLGDVCVTNSSCGLNYPRSSDCWQKKFLPSKHGPKVINLWALVLNQSRASNWSDFKFEVFFPSPPQSCMFMDAHLLLDVQYLSILLCRPLRHIHVNHNILFIPFTIVLKLWPYF